MNILEIIEKKRFNKELSKEELDFAFNGYLNNTIKDYQMSSLLMAICINGMTLRETIDLTDLMIESGEKLDTSNIKGILVDKHSTGGVGDKVSLILGPIIAALGLKMAKLSGRGLGLTGGTIDKLESIPGFKVNLNHTEFIKIVNKVGFSIMEQTEEFTPLDKIIYNLRNASGTVSSVPLIASSIMSKKIAMGAKYILIDLKVGDGALIKTKEDANILSETMVKIGEYYGKKVITVLTDMNTPLGDNVGNALEVIEAMDVLKGKQGALRDLVISLASTIYESVNNVSKELATKEVERVLDTHLAYDKFMEFVRMQGGNIEDLKVANYVKRVLANKEGKLTNISASHIGYLSFILGSGHKTKESPIDYGVGIVLNKHIGDEINLGDTLCYIYQNDENDYTEEALKAFTIT